MSATLSHAKEVFSLPLRDKKSQRLFSLDALRGFDMFWIACGERIFHGIANGIMANHSLTQNPETWQISVTGDLNFFERMAIGVSNQLHHAPWNGFTFYDLIFPLFIFIAGVSMPFSFSNQIERAGPNHVIAKRKIYRSLVKRTLILIFLGMVINGALQFPGYEQTRFASVLGRIAVSCFFGALIFLNFNLRGQVAWFIGLLIGYWATMMLVPVAGFGAGNLSPEGNLAGYFDRLFLPGRLHTKYYDPEGLLSNIPATASALLGIFAGQFLRNSSPAWDMVKKAGAIALAGIVLLACGWTWDLFFPVNKNMWTSSFVLVAGGWSALLLSLFYLITDILKIKKWSMPFVWIGMNSILIYVASHGAINFESTAHFIFGGLLNNFPLLWQEAFLWTGVAFIQFAALYLLYKKKIFLKV